MGTCPLPRHDEREGVERADGVILTQLEALKVLKVLNFPGNRGGGIFAIGAAIEQSGFGARTCERRRRYRRVR
jgi:hypothetical protein